MALVAVRTRRKNTSGWNAEKLPVKAFALVRKTARPISQIGDGAAMALNPLTNDSFNAVQSLSASCWAVTYETKRSHGGTIFLRTTSGMPMYRGHSLLAHRVRHAAMDGAQFLSRT